MPNLQDRARDLWDRSQNQILHKYKSYKFYYNSLNDLHIENNIDHSDTIYMLIINNEQSTMHC